MDQNAVLQQWWNALTILHQAHFDSARRYERRNLLLGIPVVVLSTVVGTTVFATLETHPELWVRIGIGLLSVTAAALASLQTFLRPAELAEKHKAVAVRYVALRRELEERLALAEPCPAEFFRDFRSRWDALNQDAPTMGQKEYREAKAAARTTSNLSNPPSA